MALELLSFGLGANWVVKLYKNLKKIQKKRQKELNTINDVLFTNPVELAKYYIEPDCQETNPADRYEEDFLVSSSLIFSKIDEFFRAEKFDKPGYNQMFILSDAGMGKTSLLVMLKLLHLTSFWPTETRCIVLKLGEETISEIHAAEDKMKTILLLDALDEDPTAYNRVKERLIEILDATKNFHKVIITCRTQFFPKVESDPLERPGLIKIGGYVCPSKYLSLFNDKKVDAYLNKRFPRKCLFFRNKMKISKAKNLINKMRSLRCRPMLLSFIDDLVESTPIKKNVNEFSIYKALVDSWLAREEAKTKKPAKELLKACEILAVEMYGKYIREISEPILNIMIAGFSDLENIKAIDVKGRSLLNRNSDGYYRFSHYSIQEFLVVRYFVDNPEIEVEVKLHLTDFILQMLLESPREVQNPFKNFDLNVDSLKRNDLHGVGYPMFNLEKIILKTAVRFVDSMGALIMRKEERQQTNFRESLIGRAKLSMINAVGDNLREANLGRADLNSGNFRGANLQGVDLQRADLREFNLRLVALNRANLTEANLGRAKLMFADLQDANLSGANLHEANLLGANLRYAKGLTIEMLLKVKSLAAVEGLEPELEKKLRAKKPELFILPKNI